MPARALLQATPRPTPLEERSRISHHVFVVSCRVWGMDVCMYVYVYVCMRVRVGCLDIDVLRNESKCMIIFFLFFVFHVNSFSSSSWFYLSFLLPL